VHFTAQLSSLIIGDGVRYFLVYKFTVLFVFSEKPNRENTNNIKPIVPIAIVTTHAYNNQYGEDKFIYPLQRRNIITRIGISYIYYIIGTTVM